jgi:hypothetical protein
MMVNIMSQVADSGLLGGKQESTGMMVVKEISRMIEAFARASQVATQPKRRALSPSAPVARQQAPAAATATGPQQPAPTVAQPAASTNGFAGVVNPLDEIQRRIEAEEDPAVVAEALIAVVGSAIVQAEMKAAGGIVQVFNERLGAEWATAHMEYAQALLAAIQERAQAAGIVVIDDESGDDEASAT